MARERTVERGDTGVDELAYRLGKGKDLGAVRHTAKMRGSLE
jgi:hypothetical protein